MKETRFIAQNKEKWLESENLLEAPVKHPEKLSNLFTQIVDDLSYSRTYYQNRSVRVYLNKIAREYFSLITKHRREKKNRFALFWLDELPQIILYARKQLLISLIVFVLAAGIGIFSSINDPQFASSILSDGYVEMTKENIDKGDPMAVYKKGHQVDMFLGITLNNLKVAFMTYVYGIFLSIGTLAILLYNGIMVGCFQFFFIERGLFVESALSIWLHGTLEISSIILAGGAGLTLGTGLIFPGTYSRLQAFQLSATRSLKLMLGITPVFVVAAIIESFLTRYTEVPTLVKLALIILSAFFIIGYFVVYPWMKSRSGFEVPLQEVKLPPSIDEPVFYDRPKNVAEILKDALLFYKRYANKLLSWIFWISVVTTAAVFYLEQDDLLFTNLFGEWWVSIFLDMFYALRTPTPLHALVGTVSCSIIIYRVFCLVDDEYHKTTSSGTIRWMALLQTVVMTGLAFSMLFLLEGFGSFLLCFVFVIVLLVAFVQLTTRQGLFGAFSQTWDLVGARFGQVMGLQLVLLLMCSSFLLVLSAPLIYMYTSILQWNFAETDVWSRSVIRFLEMFIKIFAFNLIIPIMAAGTAYLCFSLYEVNTAESLKKSIASVGAKLSKQSKR